MAERCPGTTYAKLSWLQVWHIRDETYSAAFSELVNAQLRHPFVQNRDDGTHIRSCEYLCKQGCLCSRIPGFCSSACGFALHFLSTLGYPHAVALCFVRCKKKPLVDETKGLCCSPVCDTTGLCIFSPISLKHYCLTNKQPF
jgi:hypothetical protein